MVRAFACFAAAAVIVTGVAAATLYRPAAPGWHEASWHGTSWHGTFWHEISWPFPRDAWPAGRAFRCGAAACGGSVEVYVRPKLGFCNCSTGVAGDDEVDGVSDMDMISADFIPRRPGEPISIGGMAGRTRAYTLRMPDGTMRAAAGFALSRRCDLVVAASQGQAAGSLQAQRAIVDLLETGPIADWIMSRLGKG